MTRAVGFALYGPPAAELFAPVPKEAYLAALVYDVENMEEDIAENPVYCTLNLCRVLAFCRDSAVLSKAAGGAWGLVHLDRRYHPLIRQALDAYEKGTPPPGDREGLRQFAIDCLEEITEERKGS